MEPVTRTSTPLLAVNTNTSSTAFFDRVANNRALAIRLAIGVVAAVVLIAAGVLLYQHRASVAAQKLADAMRLYDTPVAQADQPIAPGTKTFGSVEERARAANPQFAGIADSYGMTPAGRNALYLQGVTALQMGQTATAENLLKKSSASWNRDIATLAEMSLAGLYRGSGRESDAINLYKKVADKPSVLVPAGLAQLQLAELYEGTGKPDEARKIYASIKDKDSKSAAAEIATQKLNPAAAR